MGDQREPKISDATRAADRRDAETKGHADRMPTPDEEARADQLSPDPEASASAREQYERGAKNKGEGRID
jgi:hypothetical protein